MELSGKTINFLGDSITEGIGVADIPNCRFDNVIKKRCGLKAVNNYGIGGTRIAHQIHASLNPRYDLCFCGRAFDLDPTADIIVVFGGANDYIHGDAPIGKKGDRSPSTFYGAVYFLMNFLKKNYPKSTVVFITPAHCTYCGGSDTEISRRSNKRYDAMPLLGYSDIIEECARDFGIPTLNMYHKLGIDPNIETDRERYAEDGIHFNDAGHAVIADRIIEFLRSI